MGIIDKCGVCGDATLCVVIFVIVFILRLGVMRFLKSYGQDQGSNPEILALQAEG